MPRFHRRITFAILFVLSAASHADQPHWSSWRGPSGQGYSNDQRVPLRWNEKEKLLWKTPLPGRGNSTPIIWGRRVFLTAASQDGAERYLLCIDAHDGKLLWQRVVSRGVPAGKTHPWNGYASASCVTDGERVYAFFGTPGLFCYDMAGKELWTHGFGVFTSATGWGSAASPLLFDDLVIQNCDNDGEAGLRPDEKGMMAAPMALVALDKRTGKVRWSTPRNQGRGFSTPRLITTAADKIEMVLNGPDGLWAYDPKSGKEIWHCRRSADKGQAKFGEPMPVGDRDALFAFSGRPGPIQAIRPGGSGEIGPGERLWESRRKGRDVASPILWKDLLYAVDNRAVLTCFEAKTGKAVYSKRLSSQAQVLASPVAVRSKLLFLFDTGETVVLEPGPTYKEAGRNVLGDKRSLDFAASPAIVAGRFYLRSQSYLYCIGE